MCEVNGWAPVPGLTLSFLSCYSLFFYALAAGAVARGVGTTFLDK